MQNDCFSKDSLHKIKNGDSQAFEILFRNSCEPLVRFAYRFVRDIAVAENIVQDVFVAVWQNRANINPELDFKAYLYRAVKNKALNFIEKANYEEDILLNLDQSSIETKTPHDDIQNKKLKQSIAEAIANLPEKCRLIFALSRYDGLTYAEIAATLDISVKTVETQMGRALKYLRQHLAHLLTLMLIFLISK